MAKGKVAGFDPRKPKKLTIFTASRFPAWQDKYIELVRELFDATTLSVDDKALKGRVAKMGEVKKAMPFVQGLKSKLVTQKEDPATVFERETPFDEGMVLAHTKAGLIKQTGCKEVTVVKVEEPRQEGLPQVADSAVPGGPSFFFENV